MRLSIQHTTTYHYPEAMGYVVAALCLTPHSSVHQTVEHWKLRAPGKLFENTDGYGNSCHSYSVIGSSSQSQIIASGVVDTLGVAQWQEEASHAHPLFYLRSGALTEPHARMRDFARGFVSDGLNGDALLGALLYLAAGVLAHVEYQKNRTVVETVALEAFDWGAGVCQDQAHVMLAMCRSLNIPARYVSGYFYAENEPDLASHAWVDVCVDVEKRLWASIDVTHACLMDTRHVRIATGIDYASCTPVRGIRFGGAAEEMRVEVAITPLVPLAPLAAPATL